MKAKRLLALLLAAVLGASVLTGCGGKIDANKTGATLDGQEISLGFMNFMARYQQAIYDGQFSAMFGGASMWSQDMFNDGTDMQTSVKKNVSETVEIFYLLEKHMADYKVEITEDELAAMDKAAKQFMEDNSKQAISQLGATEEYVKEMLRLNTIQAKMRAEMDKEVDTEVSDEEAAQKTIRYVHVSSVSATDENGETKEYTDQEKADVKQKMEEFQNPLTGLNFQGTGTLTSPLGATLLRTSAMPEGTLIGLDRNYALEMVCAGDVMVEYDKLIDRQVERAAITSTSGFAKLYADAGKVLAI